MYVASKFEEKEMVKEVEDFLRKEGYEVVSNWIVHTWEDSLSQCAKEDIDNVKKADVLLVLMFREHNYRGVWCEMGAAYALDKKVIIVGKGYGDKATFVYHPNAVRVDSLHEALIELKKMREVVEK